MNSNDGDSPGRRRWRWRAIVVAIGLGSGALCAWSADAPKPAASKTPMLVYRAKENRFDARFESTPLSLALGRLSRATGWQVFVEPGAESRVSTTFRDLPAQDALPRILGELSYALVQEGKGAPRLLIFRSAMERATERVEASGSAEETRAEQLKRELLVKMAPGSKDRVHELAKKLGATVSGQLDGLGAYRLSFSDEAAADAARSALKGESDVESVESNAAYARPESPEAVSLGAVPPINLRPKVVADSDRVVVGLIDTGVQPLGRGLDGFLLPSISVVEGGSSPVSAEPLHGTSMAETILRGVTFGDPADGASAVRILPVDVYGSNETTSTFDIASGISRAVSSGATVINLSLGGPDDSPLLRTLIRNISQDGALVIASAGNQPVSSPTYPAAYSDVLAVTAGNNRGETAPYANYGSFVDVMVSGTTVVRYGGRSWMVTGTSPAAAYVSGMAGGLLSQPGVSAAQARRAIEQQVPFPGGPKK